MLFSSGYCSSSLRPFDFHMMPQSSCPDPQYSGFKVSLKMELALKGSQAIVTFPACGLASFCWLRCRSCTPGKEPNEPIHPWLRLKLKQWRTVGFPRVGISWLSCLKGQVQCSAEKSATRAIYRHILIPPKGLKFDISCEYGALEMRSFFPK